MAYGYRRGVRRAAGYSRRRYYRRRSTRYYRGYSRRRRSYRRQSTSKSAVVKLSTEVAWTAVTSTTGTPNWLPYSFTPIVLPGFSEYQTTYSQFRVFKAVLHINRTADETYNYLVVPSRSFATQVGPFLNGNATTSAQALVPAAAEDLLRQTKWQKTLRPSNVKPYVRVGFKPYCMIGTQGPAASTNSGTPVYFRPWEGRKWMPMSWVAGVGGSTNQQTPFFGPYVVRNNNVTGANPSTADYNFTATLTIYCQFRGQK